MTGPSTTGPADGLRVRDLTVTFRADGRDVPAVRGLDLDVRPGKVLALVGESGSGKSASVLGMLGLLPPGTRTTGTAMVNGVDLLSLSSAKLRRRLGKDVAIVFQDPMTSLNPVHTVGQQVAEAIRVHDQGLSSQHARARAGELLARVGIPAAVRRLDDYPHQFSGGMRQRVMIAIALANSPSVLVADEPTTALDVTVQAQILELLTDLCREQQTGLVLVTHDLGVVAGVADDVAVMYAGRIVERGTVDELFYRNSHPYTQGLLAAVPRIDLADYEPEPIPGTSRSAAGVYVGCSFAPRCSWAAETCLTDDPPLQELRPGHGVACLRAETVTAAQERKS
jgi:oligopeptide/dipeptide ABC transporter ATP-binding protein